MEIKQMLIPATNKKARPRTPMYPKYISIHETDNTNKGADALAHAKLQYNGNVRVASWHFQVDQGEIYQSIPTNEIAWANGDGKGTGNLQSISIELCVNSDGNFEKTKQNAVWLVQYLMKKYSIPISNVVQHNRWTGKNCPRNLRKSGWNEFINQIKSGSVSTVGSNENRILKLTNPYMSGDDVKKVQQIIGVTVDGIYGPLTMNAVTKFQKAHGLATDGIIGAATWSALLAPPPLPFYDCVVNGADKATFSARDVDEILSKLKPLLLNQTKKIELDIRTK